MLPEKRGWIQINRRQLVLTQVVTWSVGEGKEDETGGRGELSRVKIAEKKQDNSQIPQTITSTYFSE